VGASVPEVDEPELLYERDLEDWLLPYLDLPFTQDPASPFRGQDKIVANTARGGPRWGQWAQPDLMLIAIQRLPLQKRVDLDVFSFELKRPDYADLQSVYEAVAHTRFVHYSYLVWHIPVSYCVPERFNTILSACAENGVGLITFTDPQITATYQTRISPIRKEPHPRDVEVHLERLLPTADYKSLALKIEQMRAAL
jgi:hypothetical protein